MRAYLTTIEQRRGYHKAYSAKYPERIRAAKLRWRQKNRAKIAAYAKSKRAESNAHKARWAKNNPEMVALQRARKRLKAMNVAIDSSLRYHYEITRANYDEISKMQGDVCLLCEQPSITSRSKRLVVDHDHSTGGLRALLCHRCNCGLGYFKDNLALIGRAASYLQAFKDVGFSDAWASRVGAVLLLVNKNGKINDPSGEGWV